MSIDRPIFGLSIKNQKKIIMQIATEQFIFAHGKKPRGYGMWIFETFHKTQFCFNGYYSEAAKAAKQFFKGYGKITLCS